MSDLDSITDFLRLSDRIGTAGQPREEQFTAIQQAGYEVVVNLRPLADTPPREQAIVESQGMEYISIPVIWEAPTVEDVARFFEVMQANENKRVFVHCARNMRVSAFMYLYRVVQERMPAEEAAHDLHRIWEPNPVWQKLIDHVVG